MAGLGPAIHVATLQSSGGTTTALVAGENVGVLKPWRNVPTWMPATSAGMTPKALLKSAKLVTQRKIRLMSDLARSLQP
jgi:hypothetical protein